MIKNKKAGEWAPGVSFVNEYYTGTVGAVLLLVVYCLIVKKNRFILRSFLPAGKGRNHEIKVIEDTYEPTVRGIDFPSGCLKQDQQSDI